MGYGNSDIFPTVCKARLVFENDCCNIAILSTEQITHDNQASITTIGNFENLATILYGSTQETDAFLIKKQEVAYNKFKKRVFEKFRDTEAEESMTKRFNEFDIMMLAFNISVRQDVNIWKTTLRLVWIHSALKNLYIPLKNWLMQM